MLTLLTAVVPQVWQCCEAGDEQAAPGSRLPRQARQRARLQRHQVCLPHAPEILRWRLHQGAASACGLLLPSSLLSCPVGEALLHDVSARLFIRHHVQYHEMCVLWSSFVHCCFRLQSQRVTRRRVENSRKQHLQMAQPCQ